MVMVALASAKQQHYKQEEKRMTSPFQTGLLNLIDDYFVEVRRKQNEEKKKLMDILRYDARILRLQNKEDSFENRQIFQRRLNFFKQNERVFNLLFNEL